MLPGIIPGRNGKKGREGFSQILYNEPSPEVMKGDGANPGGAADAGVY